MREILFRGKRLDNGEWVEGFYNHFPCGRFGVDEHMIQTVLENGKIGMLYDIDPSTIVQYTGLKDKNGKRIFEEDIVKTDKFSEPNKQYIIKYDLQFGAFIGQDRYNVYFVTFDGDSGDFEVIGNIHDNKLEDFDNGS